MLQIVSNLELRLQEAVDSFNSMRSELLKLQKLEADNMALTSQIAEVEQDNELQKTQLIQNKR